MEYRSLKRSKPSVLVVFSSSELGGAERSLTRMVVASNADEITYDLATLDGPGPWSEWCEELGRPAITFGRRTASGKHGQFGLGEVLRAVRLIRERQYSVIYVIGLRASLALRLAKPFMRGARIVSGIRWNPDSNSKLDRALVIVERTLGLLIDLYISNSEAGEKTLRRRVSIAPGKTMTIHNGLSSYPREVASVQARSRKVATLANISPRKGYLQYLEQVVCPIVSQRRDISFVIAGRDDMNGQLQDHINRLGLTSFVNYVGFARNVEPILHDARVFVLPSLANEGCPTSVLEAMSYGVPPVTFAIDGIPELISEGEDGLMCQPANYEAMKEAILAVLDDDELAARLGNNARKAIFDKFLMTRCAQSHREAFEKLTVP